MWKFLIRIVSLALTGLLWYLQEMPSPAVEWYDIASYDVNLKDFAGIDVNDLQSLQGQGVHGLDLLYKRKSILRFRELLR